MNRSVVRALALDAFYQVVDNWVFRILAVLTALPILMTFVVGVREEGIVLLFGLKTWSYADVFGSFGGMGFLAPADQRQQLIEIVVKIVVEFLAGSMGMLPCIAATAFFVPRMLEKGAADLYFHKPVSRGALLLSRYFAGLLFVSLVAAILVGGMYLGFLLVSGHNDPGLLVAAPSLVYVFALVYSFSVLAGVVTRSTVASILLSAMFFLFNGCIQQTWIALRQHELGPRIEFHRGEEPAGSGAVASSEGAPTAGAEQPPAAHQGDERASPLARAFRVTLDVLHYVLPKTSDADAFAQKLRKALKRPDFRDDDSLVAIFRLPEELHAVDPAGLLGPEPASLQALLGEPCFAAAGDGPDAATYALWRRPEERLESRVGERVRVRDETTSQAGEKVEDMLASTDAVREVAREAVRFGSADRDDIGAALVRWRSGSADAARTRAALVFKGGDKVFTLLVDAAGEQTPEELTTIRERLTDRMGIDAQGAEDWYSRQLGMRAPLPYNVLFSIGSSLAFALLMLGLARWRLGRIAF